MLEMFTILGTSPTLLIIIYLLLILFVYESAVFNVTYYWVGLISVYFSSFVKHIVLHIVVWDVVYK